jgi:hypothetical protein
MGNRVALLHKQSHDHILVHSDHRNAWSCTILLLLLNIVNEVIKSNLNDKLQISANKLNKLTRDDNLKGNIKKWNFEA